MRDFSLNFKTLTPKSYLDNILEEKKNPDEEGHRRNLTKRCIKSFFSDLKCHPLVRPVDAEEDLRNIENLEYEALRPEFREGIEALMRDLKEKPKCKMINNKSMTGSMFLNLAIDYCD
jgi:hypothetical protein